MSSNALRTARQEHLLTQSELAAIVGLSQPLISQLELGRRRGSWRAWRRLAAALGDPSLAAHDQPIGP